MMRGMKKTLSIFLALTISFGLFIPTLANPPALNSTVITNVLIVDGSGRKSFRGSVRILDGRIIAVGSLRPKKNETVIDGGGKALAPGFIDIHNHSETGLLSEGTAATQVSQGITTIAVGPDGGSPYPIGEYLKKLEGKVSPNVLAFIGHGEVREQVMGKDLKRQATSSETAKMVKLVEGAMLDGAFGLSSGLEYDAGFSASTDEMVALARAAAVHGGIYMTHMRDEEEGMLSALKEAIEIGKRAGLPVQISHIKMGNRNVWGQSKEAIKLIEAARGSGADVTADEYPYTAWASTITVLVPSRKHDDRGEVEKGIRNVGGADKVLITSCAAHRDYEGKTLEQIAKEQNMSAADIYMQIVRDGGAGVVCNSMSEDDVVSFMAKPWVMISSDGGIGGRHPRGAGTFPRVLGRYVRGQKVIGFEEAVRKMSALPAKRLGLKDRGMIRVGYKADLVLIDPATVIDNATFTSPQVISSGIESVWVGGIQVWDGKAVTTNTPGEVIRNSRSK
jgi:N-acyl-D-amino-acid deacylase